MGTPRATYTYNHKKPPYFSLKIWLLFTDLFQIQFRIRIRNVYFGSESDPDPAKSFGSFQIRFRISNTALYKSDWSSGNIFTCRSLKLLVIR
jgi:hypothetical protein